MSEYQQITQAQTNHIQTMIVDSVYGENIMLNFFKKNNLIVPIPEGMLSYEYFDWKDMETGQLRSGIQDLTIVHPILGKTVLDIAYFGLKIEIGLRVVDNWRNARNPLIGQQRDILSEALRQAVKPMNRTISAFYAYGDDNVYLRDDDPMKGKGKFKGLFNSGQIFAAGGGDNIMHAAGDYGKSAATARKLLGRNEFKKSKYLLMSDDNTYEDAQWGNAGVHYITGNGKHELDIMLEREYIAGWAESHRWYPHSAGYPTTEESHILMTTPTTPDGDLAYRALQGYDFKVLTPYGGNYDANFNYNLGIIWCGVFDPLIKHTSGTHEGKSKAILVSGALDFDGA